MLDAASSGPSCRQCRLNAAYIFGAQHVEPRIQGRATLQIQHGDGTGEQTLFLNPNHTFALNHVYVDDGTYPVLVRVFDGTDTAGKSTSNKCILS